MTDIRKAQYENVWKALEPILASEEENAFNGLLGFLSGALVMRDWPRKRLDASLVLGEAAIADAMSYDTPAWTERANVHLYNVSANLADCWNDGMARERRHFERGLQLAEEAIILRTQLQKGPRPLSLAYWVKGKHLLSLGRYDEAETAFERSATHGEQADPLGALLSRGFVELARAKQSKPDARAAYEKVIAALTANGGDDAAFYKSQLEESDRLN